MALVTRPVLPLPCAVRKKIAQKTTVIVEEKCFEAQPYDKEFSAVLLDIHEKGGVISVNHCGKIDKVSNSITSEKESKMVFRTLCALSFLDRYQDKPVISNVFSKLNDHILKPRWTMFHQLEEECSKLLTRMGTIENLSSLDTDLICLLCTLCRWDSANPIITNLLFEVGRSVWPYMNRSLWDSEPFVDFVCDILEVVGSRLEQSHPKNFKTAWKVIHKNVIGVSTTSYSRLRLLSVIEHRNRMWSLPEELRGFYNQLYKEFVETKKKEVFSFLGLLPSRRKTSLSAKPGRSAADFLKRKLSSDGQEKDGSSSNCDEHLNDVYEDVFEDNETSCTVDIQDNSNSKTDSETLLKQDINCYNKSDSDNYVKEDSSLVENCRVVQSSQPLIKQNSSLNDSCSPVKQPSSQNDSCSPVKQPSSQNDSCSLVKQPSSQNDSCSPVKQPSSQNDSCSPVKQPSSQNDSCSPVKQPSSQNDGCSPVKQPSSQNDGCSPVKQLSSQNDSCSPVKQPSSQNDGCSPVKQPSSQNDSCSPVQSLQEAQNETVSNDEAVTVEETSSQESIQGETITGEESSWTISTDDDITSSETSNNDSSNDTDHRRKFLERKKIIIKVPKKYVGRVIGARGTVIISIQSESGATINFLRDKGAAFNEKESTQLDEMEQEKEFEIIGTDDSIRKAQQKIQNLVKTLISMENRVPVYRSFSEDTPRQGFKQIYRSLSCPIADWGHNSCSGDCVSCKKGRYCRAFLLSQSASPSALVRPNELSVTGDADWTQFVVKTQVPITDFSWKLDRNTVKSCSDVPVSSENGDMNLNE